MSESVEYRSIAGWSGYRVGSDGSVWTCLESFAVPGHRGLKYRPGGNWVPLRLVVLPNGYLRAMFSRNGVRKTFLVHRLVLEVFVGPCPSGMEACHGDGDRTNNRLDNLRWDTPQANWSDRRRHGRSCNGEGNPQAKLTADQVREIRRRCKAGESKAAVAGDFGITDGMVGHIVRRRKWAWLPDEGVPA